MDNYRGIAISSFTSKLLEIVLLIEKVAEHYEVNRLDSRVVTDVLIVPFRLALKILYGEEIMFHLSKA